MLGSWIRLISGSVYFASHRSHHALLFAAVAGTTLVVVVSFARQREVQNSLLAAWCTVAISLSVDNVNNNE